MVTAVASASAAKTRDEPPDVLSDGYRARLPIVVAEVEPSSQDNEEAEPRRDVDAALLAFEVLALLLDLCELGLGLLDRLAGHLLTLLLGSLLARGLRAAGVLGIEVDGDVGYRPAGWAP